MRAAAERWGLEKPPFPPMLMCPFPTAKEEFLQRRDPHQVRNAAQELIRDVFAEFLSARLVARHPLEEVDRVIHSSRTLFELKEDWDGEGASPISEETWNRAVRFLRSNSSALFYKYSFLV